MCAALGYRMRAVVPNRVPLEKKVLLRIAGAEVDVVNDDVCPSPGLGEGSINLAKTYARAQADKYVMPNQYENEENVRAHYETTGPEIWRQTEGRLTHLFLSLGTCGTVTGCSRFLKERNPTVRVIAVQPSEGHDVPGLRNVSQLDVSKLYDPSVIDEVLELDYELAYVGALDLSQKEGLLAGPSSGLIFEGARRVIERDRAGFGVMIFPDNVFKYISSMVKHVPQLTEGTQPR
jgi:cysteine synthase